MAEASIPADLFNPGQVFACLGFLEAADVLLGDAEGGFDWSDGEDARFRLRTGGADNPFAVVLEFLAKAKIRLWAPSGYRDPKPKNGDLVGLELSEAFPSGDGEPMALPIRLVFSGRPSIDLSHWADGSSRYRFKLYGGNRSAEGIARAMLRGTRGKPTKKQHVGDAETEGVDSIWNGRREALIANPFDVLTPMRGSFNFDPRGAWTGVDAGYSPDKQNHWLAASPTVEILTAIGLEHARPKEPAERDVHYRAWGHLLPPILARPALVNGGIAFPFRSFHFTLALSGTGNKVVTYAEEEQPA